MDARSWRVSVGDVFDCPLCSLGKFVFVGCDKDKAGRARSANLRLLPFGKLTQNFIRRGSAE